MSASANDAINDEITSINSIFDDGTLEPISADASLCALRLPFLAAITLRIEFPADYPDAPPSILGTQTVGEDVAKGVGNRLVEMVRDVLANLYRPGEACIYDVLEETREAVEKAQEHGTLQIHPEPHAADEATQRIPANHSSSAADQGSFVEDLGPPPPWTIAPPLTEKKSVFVGRVAPVSSPAQAKSYLAHLLATDKRVAKATHNITAWRIRGEGETSYQDCDDDGETAAGGRVLHLMQLMDVWNVMVVVTRWYGGVLLGPDRFRIINTAAREALVLGGFDGGSGSAEGKKKKK